MASKATKKSKPGKSGSVNQICRLCMGENSLEIIVDHDVLHRCISDFLSVKVFKFCNWLCLLFTVIYVIFCRFRIKMAWVNLSVPCVGKLYSNSISFRYVVRKYKTFCKLNYEAKLNRKLCKLNAKYVTGYTKQRNSCWIIWGTMDPRNMCARPVGNRLQESKNTFLFWNKILIQYSNIHLQTPIGQTQQYSFKTEKW